MHEEQPVFVDILLFLVCVYCIPGPDVVDLVILVILRQRYTGQPYVVFLFD